MRGKRAEVEEPLASRDGRRRRLWSRSEPVEGSTRGLGGAGSSDIWIVVVGLPSNNRAVGDLREGLVGWSRSDLASRRRGRGRRSGTAHECRLGQFGGIKLKAPTTLRARH